jgi:hypothetical protein
MPWTKEQGERVLAALGQKLERCPICQATQFGIQPDLVRLTIGIEPQNPFSETRAVPAIVAQCKSCGHLMLFNPLLLGLQEALNLTEFLVPNETPKG